MKLPRYRKCFVCGSQNPYGLCVEPELEDNLVVIHFTPEERHCGFHDWLHGGIIASLLDEAMFWAAAVGLQRMVATASLTLRYHRPVPIGARLKVAAGVKYLRRNLAVTEGSLLGADGSLHASAEGQYVAIQAEGQDLTAFFPDDEEVKAWDLSKYAIAPKGK
jgi:uncharacterized protein (TIGR00369 family)